MSKIQVRHQSYPKLFKDGDDWQKNRAGIFGERMALKAMEIFS